MDNIISNNVENVPDEIKKWNWGAFFFTWIWAISHNVYIGLIALLFPFNFLMAIILGLRGNEWAWKNRKFESITHFQKVQKKWALWGFIFFLTQIILYTILIVLYIQIFIKLINGNLV
ncbi:MAG: ribonuclease G [Armatimonadota bacterium]